ncbi:MULTISPECIES: DNA polymerase III subunit delta' [Vibrio]|uniref:DNA polymerase III subunit delta' n=1 Tax=Vibrio mediterranei TaxID=689 RepID=A0ABX5DJZ1_9VIBR|nr:MULTISPECIES: DNA polymerase III subunit delta' [Vibrio]MCF4174658.1 DNA polymerase III subunit delta' [Vibrio sp. McD22-P3]MCG9658638.1 DNA polymerase III subunit delta' [Vibrio mediterranei]PCD90096.1 DNA polymerase III subunit delta' [Vibrio mediterranei]PRQ69483.1 DNA polymerase III subunit delta' [Vibrio mediterranei]PTC06044.1 DNA polymerase III subunit delta' [Vibrio mediterranei]
MQVYPWLVPTWSKLKDNLERQHVPGAMLIQAKVGLAPESMIERYVAGLMCQNDKSEPCGFCHCCDLLKASGHPDVHYVLPEKDKKSLSVEQIRQANKWALESSQFGHYRVIVIPQADRMNASAANALLKTLEEPPAQCLFILSTENTKLLLPTIRSRCEVWHVSSPSEQMCIDWVSQEIGKSVPRHSALLCHFEPISTRQFVESGQDKEYQALIGAFIGFIRSDGLDTNEFITTLTKNSSELSTQLNWLWLLLSCAQKSSLGIDIQTSLPEASQIAEVYSYESLYTHAQSLQALSEQLRSFPGLNIELLVADWLYGLN